MARVSERLSVITVVVGAAKDTVGTTGGDTIGVEIKPLVDRRVTIVIKAVADLGVPWKHRRLKVSTIVIAGAKDPVRTAGSEAVTIVVEAVVGAPETIVVNAVTDLKPTREGGRLGIVAVDISAAWVISKPVTIPITNEAGACPILSAGASKVRTRAT